MPTIALAGYTNVGKSTLLNALTGREVSVENRLFETLDPTTRGFEHDGRRYLVTDTVGFIRRLPHQLVEGFAATLEETLVADIVLHVADASAGDDAARRDGRARSRRCSHEIGADELPVQLVLNKIDRRRRDRPPPAREPLPGRAAGLRRDRRGARGAEGADRRAVREPLGAGAAAAPVRRGRPPVGALRARRADRGARGHARTACSSSRACRAASSGGSRRTCRRGEQRETRLIELPIRRLRDDAVLPTRAYAGDAGLDLSACERVELGAGRARARRRPGSRSRSPTGYAGFVQPRSGLAAKHGISIVNTPGLVDSGYRGELLRQPPEHRPRARPSSSSPGCGSRSSSSLPLPEVELVEVDELPESERGVRGFGSSTALMGSRASASSALLRWQDRVLLCRQEKPGKEYWLLPGRRRRRRRDARRRRSGASSARSSGSGTTCASRARSRSPSRSRRTGRPGDRHVVHIVFGADLSHRSLEDVESHDAAIRGAAALLARRARGDRPPPADEALRPALAAGRPGGVPRLALDPLAPYQERPPCQRRALARRETACASRLEPVVERRELDPPAVACASASASSRSANHGLRGSSGPWR